jgi:putative cell wall-binding protein
MCTTNIPINPDISDELHKSHIRSGARNRLNLAKNLIEDFGPNYPSTTKRTNAMETLVWVLCGISLLLVVFGKYVDKAEQTIKQHIRH